MINMNYQEANKPAPIYYNGGFTQNIVQREGDFVTKTGKTASDEAAWYAAYLDKNDIPKVDGFSFETVGSSYISLKMEFLESVGPVNLDQVIELVEKYKAYQWLNKLEFRAYYERILFHVEQSEISNGHKLLDALKPIKLEPTFAHGDLSIRNIIQTETGPKLIDPLYFRNFGSYILDYAKLAFTLKFFNGDVEGFEKIKNVACISSQTHKLDFDVLVASEAMRVSTYNHKFDFICENLINEL